MIAIIDYGAGNWVSVFNAVQQVGYEVVLTHDINVLRNAEKVILPGVGAAASAMEALDQRGLTQVIPSLTQPLLGICVGQQLLCAHSQEGDVACLGVFDVPVLKFPEESTSLHVGWNELDQLMGPLFNQLAAGDEAYFLHSYYAPLNNFTTAQSRYTLPFSASMQRDNFYATQFHPEKSGPVGLAILKNFLAL